MDDNLDHPNHHASLAAEGKSNDPVRANRNHERRALDAPELYVEEPKYPAAHTRYTTAPEAITSDDKEVSSSRQPNHMAHRKLILGCAPITFALLTLLVILLIGAAIGGGVGGHLAAANKPTATITATVTAQPNPTPTPTTSTIGASRRPTNTTTAPTTTLSPSASQPFHFTLYASPSFAGSAHTVSPTTGSANVSLPWSARSYVWDQRGSVCCALFCRGGRDVGYRCNGVTYQDDVSGGGVDGVAVQCGGNDEGGEAPPGGWCEA
ncbi:uncharacterized protein BKCO1_1400096 [Diplodia corticola]|uniref:Uncharacterized protein n=1 Tax=Diplodia corticola TaxID=236234 RepID=A0A1J9S8U9_9PEZI|nr:uncharacterized protein BKCO1_1400096 [Diplodia corticola]OJD36013.1 hypothetical protein BKCO1_1400096 [Diplodia corticola]